ncbi:MAG: hypothetical protein P8J29_11885 [Rhodospirillales bacterium]|nr:hypothetical protein [Rhodospirillales bacterium]
MVWARKYGFVLVGLLLASVGSSHTAVAQSPGLGMDREAVAKELSEKHREKTVGMGLSDNGGVLELFTSEGGETWTVLLTMPNGTSFVVGTGKAWAGKPVPIKGLQI